jgi:hypothetical protein
VEVQLVVLALLVEGSRHTWVEQPLVVGTLQLVEGVQGRVELVARAGL